MNKKEEKNIEACIDLLVEKGRMTSFKMPDDISQKIKQQAKLRSGKDVHVTKHGSFITMRLT
jgi:NADPH:quinone reductase-like Zn-dependent oxidoreductase